MQFHVTSHQLVTMAVMLSFLLFVDFDEMPSEVFDDWIPEENISKQILLSFLNHIGCFKSVSKKRKGLISLVSGKCSPSTVL